MNIDWSRMNLADAVRDKIYETALPTTWWQAVIHGPLDRLVERSTGTMLKVGRLISESGNQLINDWKAWRQRVLGVYESPGRRALRNIAENVD